MTNLLILSVLNDGNSAQMENISGNAWWIPKSSAKLNPGTNSFKFEQTPTTYKPVKLLENQVNYVENKPNSNTKVVNLPEVKSGSKINASEATDRWEQFLGK